MAAPAKFLFDMDFGTPDRVREKPATPAEIAQKIAEAEARAYRDGYDAAQREAKAESDRRVAVALEGIGVAIQGIAGTVENAGTIDSGAGSAGVFLTHGGGVTNAADGQIVGGYGVITKGEAATVLNAGTIIADTANAAIQLSAGACPGFFM